MVEVQALCRRQQEQDSVCDLWAEMRRSYADVAKQAVDLSPKKKERTGKQGNTVREHLEEVASKLAAVAAGTDSHQPMDVQTNELDLQSWQGEAGPNLEAALRAMPEDDEDFANERKCDNREDCRDKSRHGREQAY